MPPALSSPGFLAALAVLLANDLWWKPAFGNWLTDKLSDFAGLFVVGRTGHGLPPRQRASHRARDRDCVRAVEVTGRAAADRRLERHGPISDRAGRRLLGSARPGD